MKVLTTLFTLTLVTLITKVTVAKEWEGIVPLHSTRANVEKILGIKSSGERVDKFTFKTDLIQIRYTTKLCEADIENGTWDVPLGTVVSIRVTPQKEILFSALGFNKEEFDVTSTDVVGMMVYKNQQSGFELEVNEITDKVYSFLYYWTESDKHLRCPKKN